MTRREFIRSATSALTPRYGCREAEAIARLVGETLSGVTREALALDPDVAIDALQAAQDAVGRIAAGEPAQYVLGVAWFAGRQFTVGKGVLIPRPETEELVAWIASSHDGGRILDIGTGSGAIAVTLALDMPGALVDAVDISPEALATAAHNASTLGARVDFARCDILNEFPGTQYDIIVSNPPYIPFGEMPSMAAHVIDHEPHTALFVPDGDPLLFYRAIARKGNCGWLYFEVHESHAEEVCAMLAEEGFVGIELRRDLNGRERMVRARKTPKA